MQRHTSLQDLITEYETYQASLNVFKFTFINLDFIHALLEHPPNDQICMELSRSIKSIFFNSKKENLYAHQIFISTIQKNLYATTLDDFSLPAKTLFQFIFLNKNIRQAFAQLIKKSYRQVIADFYKKEPIFTKTARNDRKKLYNQLLIVRVSQEFSSLIQKNIAINFLCRYIYFFDAPFVNPYFQTWAQQHKSIIAPLSQKIVNILQDDTDRGANYIYDIRLNKFKAALESYIISNDINKITLFLIKNSAMVQLLASSASNKDVKNCIENWYKQLPIYQQDEKEEYIDQRIYSEKNQVKKIKIGNANRFYSSHKKQTANGTINSYPHSNRNSFQL